MDKKLFKNIFFIVLSFLFIIIICIFNYTMDPYQLFRHKYYMNTANVPVEFVYTLMKNYKNYNYDTVIIGGSEVFTMFNFFPFNRNHFDIISIIGGINYEQYNEMLESYLTLHPKTKNVIISINYRKLLDQSDLINLPEFQEKYTLKELSKLLFSLEVTRESLLLLYNKIVNKNNQNINEYEIIAYKPFLIASFSECRKDYLKKLEKKNFDNTKSLINMLEERNIDYKFIIPPYSAFYLSLINSNELWQQNINNYKKYLVSIVPEGTEIYDFAFVNKYTASSPIQNDEGLYTNSDHPSFIFGAKVFKVLYDKKISEDSIYLMLTKENVDNMIDYESKLLKKYIENNKKSVYFYIWLSENQKEEYLFFEKIKLIKDITKNSQEEYKYLLQKIKENDIKNKILSLICSSTTFKL